MPGVDFSKLTRPLQPLPEDIRSLLEARQLMTAYRSRPAYQQNDYLGWIARASRPETRQKRIDQMLAELAHGGLYMKMQYSAKEKLPRSGA